VSSVPTTPTADDANEPKPTAKDISNCVFPNGKGFNSWVWRHLKFNLKFKRYALCTHCKPPKWLRRTDSMETSNLRKHLKTHKIFPDADVITPRSYFFFEFIECDAGNWCIQMLTCLRK
jgi:hypothetical protein